MENHESTCISEKPKLWQTNSLDKQREELARGGKDKTFFLVTKGRLKVLTHLLNMTKMRAKRNFKN